MISALQLLLLASLAPAALAIYCFECDSSQHFSCTEFWDPTLIVTEQVHGLTRRPISAQTT
jgi:hypothetical protein